MNLATRSLTLFFYCLFLWKYDETCSNKTIFNVITGCVTPQNRNLIFFFSLYKCESQEAKSAITLGIHILIKLSLPNQKRMQMIKAAFIINIFHLVHAHICSIKHNLTGYFSVQSSASKSYSWRTKHVIHANYQLSCPGWIYSSGLILVYVIHV